MKVRAYFSALLVVLSAAANVQAQEEIYRLGVQDRLRIHVHEWPVLTGEFAVGANGTVTLPLIGQVPATGLQPSELAASIADRLRRKVELAAQPETVVEVAQYRPFYILGGVERPGEYAYRPGMLVVNAVTIAGGAYRPPRTSDWGFERDTITGRGDLRLSGVHRNELLAKEMRLKAEAENLEVFPSPAPGMHADLQRLVDEERRLFNAHLDRHRNQFKALGETILLLEREIESLKGQIGAAQKQRDSVARELDDTRALVGRGLAPAPRLLPLERTLAQIEREQKEIETAILRARQQINLTNIQRSGMRDERRSTAVTDLRALQVQLQELEERSETASRLIAGSSAMASTPLETTDTEFSAPLSFAIIRNEGGVAKERPVTETTRVEPGDIIKVFRPQEARSTRSRAVPASGLAPPSTSMAPAVSEPGSQPTSAVR